MSYGAIRCGVWFNRAVDPAPDPDGLLGRAVGTRPMFVRPRGGADRCDDSRVEQLHVEVVDAGCLFVGDRPEQVGEAPIGAAAVRADRGLHTH